MRYLGISATVAVSVAAAGCGMTPTLPGLPAYRIDIQQGNFVSQEMVSQLKPGMTREQVRFVLGTPLVTDIFHSDRWDYVFYRDPPGRPREQRRLAVFFDVEGRLVRLDGDVVPAAAVAPADAPATPRAEPAMPPKPVALPQTKPVDPPPPAQNWRAASDAEPAKPEPVAAPAAKEAPPRATSPTTPATAAEPAKAEPGERGFFGRMWDKVKGKD